MGIKKVYVITVPPQIFQVYFYKYQFKSRDLIIKILNSQSDTVGTAKHVLIIQLIIAYRLYQHD